jgi:hypothetical protein
MDKILKTIRNGALESLAFHLRDNVPFEYVSEDLTLSIATTLRSQLIRD